MQRAIKVSYNTMQPLGRQMYYGEFFVASQSETAKQIQIAWFYDFVPF